MPGYAGALAGGGAGQARPRAGLDSRRPVGVVLTKAALDRKAKKFPVPRARHVLGGVGQSDSELRGGAAQASGTGDPT
jgi:hypothetical protein